MNKEMTLIVTITLVMLAAWLIQRWVERPITPRLKKSIMSNLRDNSA
jgi:hypothetical protein